MLLALSLWYSKQSAKLTPNSSYANYPDNQLQRSYSETQSVPSAASPKKVSRTELKTVANAPIRREATKRNVEIVDLPNNVENNKAKTTNPSKTDDFQAGLEEIKTGEFLSDIAVSIKVGAIAPNMGIVGDLSFLPFEFFDNAEFRTRVSLGFVQEKSIGSALVGYVNEVAEFKTSVPTLSFYVGGGINQPFTTGGKLGYNLLAGLEQTMNVFGSTRQSAFLETGVNTYSANGIDTTSFNIMAGYKFEF